MGSLLQRYLTGVGASQLFWAASAPCVLLSRVPKCEVDLSPSRLFSSAAPSDRKKSPSNKVNVRKLYDAALRMFIRAEVSEPELSAKYILESVAQG